MRPPGFSCGSPGPLSRCMCTQGFRCGPQATNWVTHTPRRFGLVFPGSRATDPGEHFSPALVLCAWGAGSLIRVRAHPGFQLWAPCLLIWVCANQSSGVCWVCLSGVHSPEAEGLGAQEAMAAVENSLDSH